MKKLYAVVRRLEAWTLAAAMLLMAAATILNVIARNTTGNSLASTEELNQFLIVVVCFVGLSHAAGEGRHIRMSAISDVLPRTWRRWLAVLVTSSTAALLAYLAWLAWNYARGVDRISPVLGVPLSTIYLVAPFGLGLGAVQFALAAWANLTGTEAYLAYGIPDEYEDEAPELTPEEAE